MKLWILLPLFFNIFCTKGVCQNMLLTNCEYRNIECQILLSSLRSHSHKKIDMAIDYLMNKNIIYNNINIDCAGLTICKALIDGIKRPYRKPHFKNKGLNSFLIGMIYSELLGVPDSALSFYNKALPYLIENKHIEYCRSKIQAQKNMLNQTRKTSIINIPEFEKKKRQSDILIMSSEYMTAQNFLIGDTTVRLN